MPLNTATPVQRLRRDTQLSQIRYVQHAAVIERILWRAYAVCDLESIEAGSELGVGHHEGFFRSAEAVGFAGWHV